MRPRGARIGIALGLIALCVHTAVASDESVVVTRVLQLREGDTEALKALAERRDVDAWIVAHAVAGQDESAAKRFAQASDLPGTKALRTYLAGRSSTPARRLILAMSPELPDTHDEAQARADEIHELLPDADAFESAQLRSLLGRLHGWPAGRRQFDRAIALAQDVGWLSGISDMLHRSGMAALNAGDFAEARTRWRNRLNLERKRGAKGAPDHVLNNLAGLAAHVGDYASAVTAMRELVATIEASPTTPASELRDALQNLSFIHHQRGEYQSALRIDLRVADSIDKQKSPRAWADAQVAVAASLDAVGEYDEGLRRAEAALEIYEAEQKPGPLKDIGHCLAQIGRALFNQGEHEDALEALRTARQHLTTVHDKEALVTVSTMIALVHEKNARYGPALENARRALVLARERGDAWAICDLEQLVALIQGRAGRLDDALALIVPNIERTHGWGSQFLLRDAFVIHAEILLRKKDHAGALKACALAYQPIREMLVGLPEGANAKARSAQAAVFEIALTAAVARRDADEFFTWVERARSGALLESMGNRTKLLNAVVSADLLEAQTRARDRELKAQIDYRDARADPSVTRGQRRALRRAIAAAREELREIRARIQLERGAATDLFFPKSDTLADVQKRMAKAEAFLAYALVEDRAYALVVRKDDARIVELGPVEPVTDAARRMLAAAKTPRRGGEHRGLDLDDENARPRDTKTPLADLRKLIAEPLGLDGAVTSLIIVPDADLYSVPFAAVFDRHTVSYAPSATTLGVLAKDAKEGGRSILALGDPIYTGRSLAQLPGTKVEVKAIGKGGTILMGKNAGEESLAAALKKQKRWRAIHLACHGVIDTSHPLESALELSAEAKSDGRLMAAEVFEMQIPCDLAVLSACQTGRGTVLKSEGLLGLTRAFMVAGAPRVICSLWKVDDQATRALMVKFYELWNPKSGKARSAALALREAQAHVRKQKKWKHPYYWAAWTLWGLSD